MNLRTVIPVLAVSAAFASSGFAANAVPHAQDAASQGSSVRHAPAARLVNLDAARAVAVRAGETVTFTRNGSQFTHRFDGQGTAAFEIPLSRIAPEGFDSGKVRVYVNPDERHLPIG